MTPRFTTLLAGALLLACSSAATLGQGAPAPGPAPAAPGNAPANNGGPGAQQPAQPQQQPGAGPAGQDGETAPPHQGGGCQFQERKLELIV